MDSTFPPQLLTSTVECAVIFPMCHIYSSTSSNEKKNSFFFWLGINGGSLDW